MPFDDSDIKKMIRVQLEGRIKFPSKLDHAARDLINAMLEADVTRRVRIEKIVNHHWFREPSYT
jgi:serine kinase